LGSKKYPESLYYGGLGFFLYEKIYGGIKEKTVPRGVFLVFAYQNGFFFFGGDFLPEHSNHQLKRNLKDNPSEL